MSWVDAVFEDWGAWRRAQGDAQGWGGALELDRMVFGARDPNVHSDPVCAEWAATAHGEESGRRTVDRYIEQSGPVLSLTARLRYAGVWVPVESCEYKDRVRIVMPEGCPRIGMEVFYREMCLTPAQIAEAMKVGVETVWERLEDVKGRVRRELLRDAKNRKNQSATRRKAA